jgi:hypothetical protein
VLLAISFIFNDFILVLTNSVNLFLDSDKEAQINTLSQSAELDEQLNGYVYEAIRK